MKSQERAIAQRKEGKEGFSDSRHWLLRAKSVAADDGIEVREETISG
jgi:hypothetical protein